LNTQPPPNLGMGVDRNRAGSSGHL